MFAPFFSSEYDVDVSGGTGGQPVSALLPDTSGGGSLQAVKGIYKALELGFSG
jgi:hypothetical protein